MNGNGGSWYRLARFEVGYPDQVFIDSALEGQHRRGNNQELLRFVLGFRCSGSQVIQTWAKRAALLTRQFDGSHLLFIQGRVDLLGPVPDDLRRRRLDETGVEVAVVFSQEAYYVRRFQFGKCEI